MAFQAAFPEASFTLVEPLFWPLRAIKDAYEVECLTCAADMTDKLFGATLKMMKLGVTIQDIADEINAQMLRLVHPGTRFRLVSSLMDQGLEAGVGAINSYHSSPVGLFSFRDGGKRTPVE